MAETDIGLGDPAHTLVDMAERNGADMVVIGAKDHGALSSALLGSVSQEVARACAVRSPSSSICTGCGGGR